MEYGLGKVDSGFLSFSLFFKYFIFALFENLYTFNIMQVI